MQAMRMRSYGEIEAHLIELWGIYADFWNLERLGEFVPVCSGGQGQGDNWFAPLVIRTRIYAVFPLLRTWIVECLSLKVQELFRLGRQVMLVEDRESPLRASFHSRL
jgi:hypothetical protein